jgi:hypothetical protein
VPLSPKIFLKFCSFTSGASARSVQLIFTSGATVSACALTIIAASCGRSELGPSVYAYTALLAPPRDAGAAAARRQLELVRSASWLAQQSHVLS